MQNTGSSSIPFPGYEYFSYELATLISTHPPPFIYIQDTEALRTSSGAVDALLRDLSNAPSSPNQPKLFYARVDGVSCFTSRLFYESVINTLVGWEPDWEGGCENWAAEGDIRWNENIDSFLHGLRAARLHLCRKNNISASKGKGKQHDPGRDNVRLVIVVERVERLKETLPELLVPLTRLAELTRLDLSVIFISQVGWAHIRPPLGASPDPYYIDIQSPSKENIVRSLLSNFSALSSPTTDVQDNPYHPALKPLYSHFATLLCDVCYPFTHDPQELQYIAAARWPGFSKPLTEQYNQRRSEEGNMEDDGLDLVPSEDMRMRLNKIFNLSLSAALDALLPRITNATDWALANQPPADILSMPRTTILSQVQVSTNGLSGIKGLPRMSKFILLASFLASTNPSKSDIRMFGRGLDEKKRKRRPTKASGKTRGGGPAKVSQRLLGPTVFPFDRMIAILGALLEENDADSRTESRMYTIAGEYTDMEIGRIGILTSVTELTSMSLLHRTSQPDRLDGPPQFKCAISYETALLLAKQLDVALNDLLWDPM